MITSLQFIGLTVVGVVVGNCLFVGTIVAYESWAKRKKSQGYY